MNGALPILWNHDHGKPIGTIRADGDRLFFAFSTDVNITDEGLYSIFGNAGIQITEFEMVGDMRIIRAGQILEFSL